MPLKNLKKQGKEGENLACQYLQNKGYKIFTTNFRSKFGEIDIVAQYKSTLVFVEVKTRWSQKYGLPEEAVTRAKIRSIVKTAEYFKLKNPQTPGLMRIDVIAIEKEGGETVEIRHHENVTG